MALEPGARLGPYEIVSPAGAGGMGEVYRARDTRLDRTVALKVLPPDLTNDPAARQRFEREARAVAALSHPHICTLHDIGQQDGTDFLVMEYLDGETLAKRLTRGKLPLDQALHYSIQIADALAAAHTRTGRCIVCKVGVGCLVGALGGGILSEYLIEKHRSRRLQMRWRASAMTWPGSANPLCSVRKASSAVPPPIRRRRVPEFEQQLLETRREPARRVASTALGRPRPDARAP